MLSSSSNLVALLVPRLLTAVGDRLHVTAVACGGGHALAVVNGGVLCWGAATSNIGGSPADLSVARRQV